MLITTGVAYIDFGSDEDGSVYSKTSSSFDVLGEKGNKIGAVDVLLFEQYKDENAGGVRIQLGYRDLGSGMSNFNWIQSVLTGSHSADPTPNKPFNDPTPPR